MQTNKHMASFPRKKSPQHQHRHNPLRPMPDRISSRQTTTQQSNPQRVRAKNAAGTCAILPRGGVFPNQTIVAQGHQKQSICIVAGPHMGGGQQAFPQVQRDIERPRTKDKEWITINKNFNPKRLRQRNWRNTSSHLTSDKAKRSNHPNLRPQR